MTAPWFILFVAVALLGLVLIVAGLYVRRSRPRLGVITSVLGAVITLAIMAVPVLTFLGPSRDDTVWVSGPASGDPRFSLEVPHDAVSVEGSRYVFASDLTWDELLETASEQHPAGAATDQGWWWTALGDTVIVLSQAADGTNEYLASAQFVTVDQSASGSGAAVPFPALALGRDAVGWGEPLHVGWAASDWQEFYALIGVGSSDGTFAVPTSNGGTANVMIDSEGVATIERAG